MLFDVATTHYCFKTFIESLERHYIFEWERVDVSYQWFRIRISNYLFEFKMVENVLIMDMYLNMNDAVPIQYQPKLARVTKDLGEQWWDSKTHREDTDCFVSMCADRFVQVDRRIRQTVFEVDQTY